VIELRCSRDLALKLGAFPPETIQHHKKLARDATFMLVRDKRTGWALFWQWQPLDTPRHAWETPRLTRKSS